MAADGVCDRVAPVMAKLVEIVHTTVTAAMASTMPSTDRTNRSG
jgi:hypothetical protein